MESTWMPASRVSQQKPIALRWSVLFLSAVSGATSWHFSGSLSGTLNHSTWKSWRRSSGLNGKSCKHYFCVFKARLVSGLPDSGLTASTSTAWPSLPNTHQCKKYILTSYCTDWQVWGMSNIRVSSHRFQFLLSLWFLVQFCAFYNMTPSTLS